MVANVRVAFNAFYGVAVFVQREALGPQRDPLVKFYMRADNARFPNHHTGTVVNKKGRTNLRAGVNINASQAVG